MHLGSTASQLTANQKHFVIPHPLTPGSHCLVHACLEGPEHGVYYRGEARLHHDRAEITLPDYFDSLTRSNGRSVLLTPIHDGDETVSALSASDIIGGRFQVRSIDGVNLSQRFWWEVKAIRADIQELEVERKRPGADATVAPTARELVEAAR